MVRGVTSILSRWDCGSYRGIVRDRGGAGPAVDAGLSRNPARFRGTLLELVGPGTHVRRWVHVCLAAGGNVVARVARRLPVTHAAVMGIIQAGLTIVAMLSPEGNHASPTQWILTAITQHTCSFSWEELVTKAAKPMTDWKELERATNFARRNLDKNVLLSDLLPRQVIPCFTHSLAGPASVDAAEEDQRFSSSDSHGSDVER